MKTSSKQVNIWFPKTPIGVEEKRVIRAMFTPEHYPTFQTDQTGKTSKNHRLFQSTIDVKNGVF
jgi:hypothetical protein